MKAKLFAGIMYRDQEVYNEAIKKLTGKFGRVETEGNPYDFNFTDYYTEEMGRPLLKRFVIFEDPIDREGIAEIKCYTNILEKEFVIEGRRRINVDPGYLTKGNIVLATTKESAHRIYLGSGIFGEVTMTFKRNGCSFFDWTYPDFRTPEVCRFFLRAREKI